MPVPWIVWVSKTGRLSHGEQWDNWRNNLVFLLPYFVQWLDPTNDISDESRDPKRSLRSLKDSAGKLAVNRCWYVAMFRGFVGWYSSSKPRTPMVFKACQYVEIPPPTWPWSHLVNIRGTDALSVCATDLPEAGLRNRMVLNRGWFLRGKNRNSAKAANWIASSGWKYMLQTYLHVACCMCVFFEHMF